MNYTLLERYYDPQKASFCNLTEGLISSYDMRKCENTLRSKFDNVVSVINHSVNRYRLPMWKDENKNMGNFEILLTSLKNIKGICDFIEQSYGWFPSVLEINNKQFIDWRRNGNFICVDDDAFKSMNADFYLNRFCKNISPKISLFVEAKFTTEDFNISNLYHITDMKNIGKIMKNGLIPKSKGNFTERVYFGKNLNDILSIFDNRYISPVILQLDFDNYGEEIMDKYVFYKDPRMSSAVFTYDCIDPKYIKIFKEKEE